MYNIAGGSFSTKKFIKYFFRFVSALFARVYGVKIIWGGDECSIWMPWFSYNTVALRILMPLLRVGMHLWNALRSLLQVLDSTLVSDASTQERRGIAFPAEHGNAIAFYWV
jgi:succinate dehydrogenase hydrophobic anchor subunit